MVGLAPGKVGLEREGVLSISSQGRILIAEIPRNGYLHVDGHGGEAIGY